MDITIADVTSSYVQDGTPLCNLGNLATGKGFSASTTIWGADGFFGIPNPATGGTACCQVLQGTTGQQRLAFCPRDDRYREQLGPLAVGDRAVTTNADAGLLLQQAANKIQFAALTQGMEVTLDAAQQKITLKTPTGQVVLSQNSVSVLYDDGATIAQLAFSDSAATISFISASVPCGITLSPAGIVNVTCTVGGFKVNGIPVTVP